MRYIYRAFNTLFFIFLTLDANCKTIQINVVTDGASIWTDAVVSDLQKELIALQGSQIQFRLGDDQIYHSEWEQSNAKKMLNILMSDMDSDIVVAIGILASDAVAKITLTKPTIAANVVEPELQGFPYSEQGTSSQEYLHYLVSNVELEKEVERLKNATGAHNIGVLGDDLYLKSLPFLKSLLGNVESESGVKLTSIRSSTSNGFAYIQNLPQNIDAVLVLPQLRFTKKNHSDLIEALRERRMPSFSMLGRDDVSAGYLMGTALLPSVKQIARRLAIDIRDIALGRNTTSLPVAFDIKDRFSLNLQTARDIGFSPPYSLLLEAEVINEEVQAGREISLYNAINESIQNNLDIAIADTNLQLAAQDLKVARAALLPQFSATADWQALDIDNAITRQTRTTSVGLNLSQTIYSESLISNFTSNKFLREAEKANFSATRLDVIETTALSYLNVLVAKTQLAIQQDNLRLTLANLDRADFRYKVGSASRSESLRFQTELGSDRQSVTNARRDYQQTINQLNQILNRPIDEIIITKEPGMADPKIFGDERLTSFLKTPRQVKLFSDFLTQESIYNSPEIVTLNNEIKSQERQLLAANRKRYIPEVALSADVSRIVHDNATPFTSNYNNDWSLGVQFSWTLYQGSRIGAEQSQAQITLNQLRFRHAQLLHKLETEMRNAVVQAGASSINIKYALDSASAAEQTLDLVTDAYVRGAASYIDLIDAQSSHLNARLISANAIYTHFQDLIAVQRAAGFFDFYVAPEQANEWFNKLYQFAQDRKVNP